MSQHKDINFGVVDDILELKKKTVGIFNDEDLKVDCGVI